MPLWGLTVGASAVSVANKRVDLTMSGEDVVGLGGPITSKIHLYTISAVYGSQKSAYNLSEELCINISAEMCGWRSYEFAVVPGPWIPSVTPNTAQEGSRLADSAGSGKNLTTFVQKFEHRCLDPLSTCLNAQGIGARKFHFIGSKNGKTFCISLAISRTAIPRTVKMAAHSLTVRGTNEMNARSSICSIYFATEII